MKTILLLLILLKGFSSHAKTILIEEGQDYQLSGVKKIWIENSNILKATQSGSGLILKAISIGETQIRKNNELIKVNVTPMGSKSTFEIWSRLSKKFIGLKVDFCEQVVCLKGKLFRYNDFERILKMIKENESSLFLDLQPADSLVKPIHQFYENYSREKGLTPLKVIFSSPWKIQFSGKNQADDYKLNFRKVGVLAIESHQKMDIADNVRVEVQITEIRKDFGRTLGIKWPDSYAAQVVDGNFIAEGSFATALHAKESTGEAKILASPNLICRNGKEAEFFAGGEFPIKILNYKIQDIVWKKYGIMLKIKPQVDSIGQMSLQIDTEISSIDKSRSVDNIPALFSNKVSSHFDLIKSQTIALSGLIKNETGSSSDGLPFLSQIPILGSLFSSKDFMENRTELVIFVTPQLMKNESP